MAGLRRLVALAAVTLLATGCSSAPHVIHARTVTLEPGPDGFAEVNLVMAANATVAWSWTMTGGANYFDVHSHAGGAVVEHVRKLDQAKDAGNFTAPKAGQYSLLWENYGAEPVSLHYEVTGNATLDPKYPPVP
ncbi:MAG: hypothetical protein ABR562_03630 [Thermoplasmatota archaeon]